MRFIVGQKQMNLSRLIVVALSASVALSGNVLSVKAAEVRSANSGRTFADWCREKSALSPETQHTIDVLLEKAGTTDCDAANRKLSSLTELNLNFNQIIDIKPLQSLTKLTRLYLDYNQIRDIKSLQSLTNLTSISLTGNPIVPKTCPLKPESICKWEP